ncbi:ATP-binding protein [Nitrosophilus alvini]|uniref:ATP-binding protein n=1 Tax=Nitrosophilus alvini TaxID=2714855 RepID=UPI00190CFBDE|nr:ATP-binding protein [Nitrosophilus alvini]
MEVLMEILEILYEKDIGKLPFINRKIKIPEGKNAILFGTKRSGKTFLIKEYLSRFPKKKRLYIDMSDLRMDIHSIKSNLQEFINKKGIEIVAIENYNEQIPLPETKQLILSSEKPLIKENFETIHIRNLDFEEYIAFEKKSQDIKAIFSNFLKNGTIPEIIQQPEYNKIARIQEILTLAFKEDSLFLTFREAALSQGHKSSPYHLFTKLKSKTRISKDRFYSNYEELKKRGYIYSVEKYGSSNAAKKIYLFDFTIKNALTFEKEFSKMFENMVFLELFKKGGSVFYYDYIDFLLPDISHAVICVPFGNEVMIQKKVHKALKGLNEHKIKEIDIVTVGSSFEFEENQIRCHVLPFYEWALIEMEG